MPRTPVEGMGLAAYAAISARLAGSGRRRAEVLSGAGLNEANWLRVEKTWALRLATALMQQDLSFAREYEDAFAAAQAELAQGTPLLPMASYADLVAAIESGREPGAVLADAKMPLAEFLEQQRRWTAMLVADRELAASFRAMVTARKQGSDR
ncbi:hypothetical protein SCE1572_19290 [Sorangium cellulosum So0157-2]|uniref:Uncharacterized protein n=1 Tax=Sorangium cellulosum So0157-2 TaxID=1254432 RepID=S4XVV7_SORCE|nr:hypothetical protein SCE1572_19290 [Sorangium cellulosum So0157-2]